MRGGPNEHQRFFAEGEGSTVNTRKLTKNDGLALRREKETIGVK